MKREDPKGAAIILVDQHVLEAILGLPPGVYIHHTFVPDFSYGRGVGVVLWADDEDILPHIEHGQRYEDWSNKVSMKQVQAEDGTTYWRTVFPKQEGAADGE